jgi:hypothetical protein
MSSYLSSEYKIQQPVSSFNVNLADNVLSTLQGKYDTNKAKIDQTLAVYNNQLRGLRTEDNEYIANRLNEVDSVIEQYKKKNGNLAYNSTTDTILSTVKSLMDDPVIKDAVKNKAYFDNYEKQVQELKKKDPKMYNDVNYQYGLYKGGYQAYMKGEAKGMSNLNYTPYNDNAEEHLKKLKIIGDLKGKRFIEQPDGKGGMIRKEIDGLEASEIQNYFEGMMTSQELTQMNINAWGKFAQPNQVEQAKTTFNLLNQATIEDKEKELLRQKGISEASGTTDPNKETAKANIETLTKELEALKKVDVNKLNPETIAFQLEKTDYLRSITRMASTEWSTEYKVDEVFKMNQDLDIKIQELEIKRAELALKVKDSNATTAFGENAIVATNTMQGDLSKELAEENKGASLLEAQHNSAYNEIKKTASDYINNADETNKNAFINNLKARGIGADLQWIDKNKGKSQSLANTIFGAWEDSGVGKVNAIYGNRMLQAYNQKQTSAKDIIKVDKEAFSAVFEEDPDKYIDFLKKSKDQLNPNFNIVSDVVGNKKAKDIANRIEAFATKAGGWANMKNYLKSNKNELTTFAKLTDEADKQYKGVDPYIKVGLSMTNPIFQIAGLINGTFDLKDNNLLEDAKAKKEELIQKYTSSGSMMSSYNQYNFNEKTNEFIANATSQTGETSYVGDIPIKGRTNMLDPKKPMSVHREGSGNNIQLVVTQALEGGYMRKTYDKGDEVYRKIESLIDVEAKKSTSVQANKDTSLESSKVKLFSTKSEVSAGKRINSAAMALQEAFPKESIIPTAPYFATQESAKDGLMQFFTSGLKVDPKVAETYTQHILDNAGLYTIKPVVGTNMTETGYEFNMQFKKEGSSTTIESRTGIDKLSKEAQYLIRYYPEVVLLNDLCNRLKQTKTEEERANIINNF